MLPNVCHRCHRTRHPSEFDLKPTLTWWLRLIRLFHGQLAMLSYAERNGYEFDRPECGQCFGPGYNPGAFVTRRSGTVEPPDAGRGVHHIDEISLSGCSVADETDKPNEHRASRIIAGYMTGISNKGELMELSRSFEP